jgi:probable HAF family extracellular repeat protein
MRCQSSKRRLAEENGISQVIPLKRRIATFQLLLYAFVALVAPRKRTFRLTAAIHFALLLPSLCAAASYNIADLGTLGGTFSQAFSINASGQVTGWASTTGGERHAFLYDGLMHDLGTLGGYSDEASAGYGINASGQVAGQDDSGGAFLWTPMTPNGASGTMVGLAGGESNAQGINASGQVAGYFLATGFHATHAYLWTPTTSNGASGTLHDLGTLGGTNSYGGQINASGQITGFSNTAGGQRDAFLWTPTTPNGAIGTMIDLGTLGGTYSQGFGINASGQVAGVSFTTGGKFHAFLYDGTLHDLGTLGGNESNAQGINSSGQVTGWASTTGDVTNHAILYDLAQGMVDLNSLISPLSGWELTNGIAINDAGQITGFGTLDGETHAFLLTPTVPEPSSLVLAGLGFATLAVWGGRRRHL